MTGPLISDLVIAVSKAIHMIRYEVVKPATFNDELKDKYSWKNVAERTEKVCMLVHVLRHGIVYGIIIFFA